MSAVAVPKRMRSSTVNGEAENFRIVMTGPDQGQRRDDGVDAGAVGQAGIDHRRRLVDAATDRGDDPVDDAHDVVVVLEDDVGQLELARALDVDLARAVDHDLGDGLVAQERLERAEADDLVGDLLEHPDALGAGQGEAFLVDDLAEDLLDLAPDLDLVGQVELRVQVLDDPVLDPELDVPERLADRRLAGQSRRRRHGSAGRHRARPAGWTRRRRRRRRLRRPDPGRALSIRFNRDIAYTPSRPEGLTGRRHVQRHANNDFFWAALRLSSVGRDLRPIADDRPGQPEDVLGDLRLPVADRKNGTPRLSA